MKQCEWCEWSEWSEWSECECERVQWVQWKRDHATSAAPHFFSSRHKARVAETLTLESEQESERVGHKNLEDRNFTCFRRVLRGADRNGFSTFKINNIWHIIFVQYANIFTFESTWHMSCSDRNSTGIKTSVFKNRRCWIFLLNLKPRASSFAFADRLRILRVWSAPWTKT